MSDICKSDPSCSFVYPILEGEAIGDSLSSVNYNFRSLDIQLCNLETDASTKWIPAYTTFSNSSADWISAMTTLQGNSACWETTRTTVNEMSAVWLKPITLVYPHPFSTQTDIAAIKSWLDENFPINGGSCFNYVVGQQFYIFSPEYYTMNRVVSTTRGMGKKKVNFTYACSCISQPVIRNTVSQTVDCGTYTTELNIPDQFINRFIGIKFEVLPSLEWSSGSKIYE